MTPTTPDFTPRRWPFQTKAEAEAAAANAQSRAAATAVAEAQAAPAASLAVTPWYPWTTEPVQIGVYQRRNSLGMVVYSLWDGERWLWNQRSPALAERETMPSASQQLPWRGLQQPPAGGYGAAVADQAATEGMPC